MRPAMNPDRALPLFRLPSLFDALNTLAIVLGLLFVNAQSAQRLADARNDSIQICSRGGVTRADRIIDTRDPDDTPAERVRVRKMFPVLWCARTIDTDTAVPLEPVERKKFVDLVEQSRIPIVDQATGRVTGSTAP